MIPFLDSADSVINRIEQKAGSESEERYALKLKFPEAYKKDRH